MKNFTIEIDVNAFNSGAAKDLMLRQLMSELGYCDILNITVYDENGNNVTNEIDVDQEYSLKWERGELDNEEQF